jgi:hypothetical protein
MTKTASRFVLVLTSAALIAACTGAGSSVSSIPPTQPGPGSPAVSPLGAPPSAPATPPAPLSSLTIVTASAPFSPTGCELPRHGAQPWPSDRLRAVAVTGSTIEFRFDAPSSQLTTPPTVTYGPTSGPLPVAVEGSGRMAIRFEHLQAAFTGTRDLHPTTSPVKEVVLAEDAAGVLTWLIGLDYAGCGSVSLDPSKLVVDLDFPVGGPVP